MKRVFAILVAILLLTAVMTVSVFAAAGGEVAVSTATGQPGQTVKLTVSLSGFANADTIGVKISCGDLQLVQDQSQWLLDGMLTDLNATTKIGAWCADGNPEDVNKAILELAFVVPEPSVGQTDLDYEVSCEVQVLAGSLELGKKTATGKVTVSNPAKTLRLDRTALELDLNGTKTAQLVATVTPANTTEQITWSSRTPEVATVSNGVVTAVKAGTAQIVATVGGLEKVCTVTVVCSHDLTKHDQNDPTCQNTGNNLYYTCDVCQAVLKADQSTQTTLAAETLAVVPCTGGTATCTQKALCKWCDQPYGETKPHSYQQTWETDGTNHWHKCKDCTATTTAEAHSYGWVVETPATPMENGSKYQQCTVCKYKNGVTEVIPHTHQVTHHAAAAATCVAEGTVEYWTCASSHCQSGKITYGDKDCTKVLTSVKTAVDPNNHGSTEVRNALEPTCYQEGRTGDTFCLACKKQVSASQVIPATGKHVADSKWSQDAQNHWHVCTTQGCGALVDKAEHSYQWKVDKKPTEETTGLKHEQCVCGVKRNENTVIAKLEHKPVLVEGKEATCTEEGALEHYFCSNCGRYYASKDGQVGEQIERETILQAATGHSFDTEWHTDAQNHWHVCACGETSEKEAHKTQVINAKEATETQEGYTGDTVCTVCELVVKQGTQIPVATEPATEPADDGGEAGGSVLVWAAVAVAVSAAAGVGGFLFVKKPKV